MDEGVYFGAYSEGIQAVDVEDVELCHEWGSVGSGWEVEEESDDLLLGSVKWLEVGFSCVVRSPNRDVSDEVGVYVAVVEILHIDDGEEFVGVSETVYGWL
jgi:hypothetical protein